MWRPLHWAVMLSGPVLFTTVWAVTPVVSVSMDFLQGHHVVAAEEQIAGCIIILAGLAFSFLDKSS